MSRVFPCCAAFRAGVLVSLVILAIHVGSWTSQPMAAPADDRPVVLEDDFEGAATDGWEPSDPKAWRLAKSDKGQVYNQFAQSNVETPVRSPFNRNLAKGVYVSDFQLDV